MYSPNHVLIRQLMRMRLSLRFITGFFLLSSSYGIYMTISRPLFGADLYGRDFVIHLVGAEYVPIALSFLVGAIGDIYGRKRVLTFSYLGIIPLAAIFLAKGKTWVLISVSLYSFFFSLAYMMGLSSVLENRREVGRAYSIIGIAMGMGWAFGSTASWTLFLGLGNKAFIAALLSIYVAGVYCMKSGYIGKERELGGNMITGLKEVYRGLRSLIPAFLLAYIGVAIGSNVNALILDQKVSSFIVSRLGSDTNPRLFYGLFYAGLPVILGFPLRILAGRLTDRGLQVELFTASVIAYLVIFIVLPFLSPLPFLLLWLVPVYPFYDTSMYAISSRRTRSYEASVSGLIWTLYSLAGMCVIFLNSLNPSGELRTYLLQMAVALSLSLAFLFSELIRARISGRRGTTL